MPATKPRPVATLSHVTASTPERGIPRTTHLRFSADYALRRAFETGQLDGTIDEFCSAAVETRLDDVASGVLAKDPEFELAMYFARRDREDARIAYSSEQAFKTIHSARHHIVLYAKMRDKTMLAAFVARRWEAAEGLQLEFWRNIIQGMYKDEALFFVVKGLHRLGYPLPASLISYLGL